MIRLGPLLWLGLVALASVGTYQLTFRVQTQVQELTQLDRQIQHDRDAIQVLRAEWSHLNDPARLADLAHRHLDLAPVAGLQMVRFEVLPQRPAPTTLPDGSTTTDPIATLLTQLDGADVAKPGATAQAAAK
jgi:hypothetical protein